MNQKIVLHSNYLIFNFVGFLFIIVAYIFDSFGVMHVLLWIVFSNNLFAVIGAIMYVDEKDKRENTKMKKYSYNKNIQGKKYKMRKR